MFSMCVSGAESEASGQSRDSPAVDNSLPTYSEVVLQRTFGLCSVSHLWSFSCNYIE